MRSPHKVLHVARWLLGGGPRPRRAQIERLLGPGRLAELGRHSREPMVQPWSSDGGVADGEVSRDDQPAGYLRIYPPGCYGAAVRHLWATERLAAHGMRGPTTLFRGFVRAGGTWLFVLGQDRVPGVHFDDGIDGVFVSLGRDLRRWHRWRPPRPGLRPSHHVERLGRMSPAEVDRRIDGAPPLFAAHRRRIHDVVMRLRVAVASDGHVVSHGDLNMGNMLVTPDGRLGWIDLDDVCWRPAFLDLAEVTMRVFRRHPERIEDFEGEYFAGDAARIAHWRRRRLDGFRAMALARTLLIMRPERAQLRADDGVARRRTFAWCAGVLELVDDGGPTSELVVAVRRRARSLIDDSGFLSAPDA